MRYKQHSTPEARAASILGRVKSPAKAAAARENGRKGGRPRKDKGYTEEAWHLSRDDGQAEAERYCKSEGDSFTGWVVRSTIDRYSYSDIMPNKREAIVLLLKWGR